LTAIRHSSDTADVTVEDLANARDTVRPSLDPAQIELPRAFADER
jgi:transitional endoplasmic reticulum ATPase